MRYPIPTFLAGAALASGLSLGARLVTWQDDGAAQDPPPDAVSEGPALDPRLVELQGAWELVRVESSPTRTPAFRHSGMMLLVDGFLSIELHLGMVDTSRELLFESYFQSGVSRVEIDAFGQLSLESAIGAQVDEEGYLDFEPPGVKRLYRYVLEGESLVLTNLQRRARLFFRRVQHDPPKRNLLGREVPPETVGEDED